MGITLWKQLPQVTVVFMLFMVDFNFIFESVKQIILTFSQNKHEIFILNSQKLFVFFVGLFNSFYFYHYYSLIYFGMIKKMFNRKRVKPNHYNKTSGIAFQDWKKGDRERVCWF